MKQIYISRPVPSLACNGNCSCDPTAFTPVCGSDGRNYFSPCYAGCQNESIVAGKNGYLLIFLTNCNDNSSGRWIYTRNERRG